MKKIKLGILVSAVSAGALLALSCSTMSSISTQNAITTPSPSDINSVTSTPKPSLSPINTYATKTTATDVLPPGTWVSSRREPIDWKETYIPLSSCSPLAQITIQRKGLPTDKIYAYKEQNAWIDTGESVTVVTIFYGQKRVDTYDEYMGVFINGQALLVDLPYIDIYNAMWGRPPLTTLRDRLSNYSSNCYQTIALRSGYYGWVYKIEYISFTVTFWNAQESRLIKQQYHWSGEIFVYLNSSNEITWDESKLKISMQE